MTSINNSQHGKRDVVDAVRGRTCRKCASPNLTQSNYVFLNINLKPSFILLTLVKIIFFETMIVRCTRCSNRERNLNDIN